MPDSNSDNNSSQRAAAWWSWSRESSPSGTARTALCGQGKRPRPGSAECGVTLYWGRAVPVPCGRSGLPTAQNIHEVAQEIAPDSRIVYVDNDPIVLAYAEALLTSALPEWHGPGSGYPIPCYAGMGRKP